VGLKYPRDHRSAVKSALPYITDEDAALLCEQGQTSEIAGGKTILEEGSCRRQLILLVGGQARVVRSHMGHDVTVASITDAEPVGEIAYFDGKGASASVVADGPAHILRLEEVQISSLLFSVPGLAARLFQSLAFVLARRLRAMTESAPSFLVDDVPQVKTARPSLAVGTAIPPIAVVAVDEFKRDMTKAETLLGSSSHERTSATQLVISACDRIKNLLQRTVSEEPGAAHTVGAHVFRATFPHMMSSALLERIYTKPRGYPGDHETIEAIYRAEPRGATAIGREIDAWALQTRFCSAVRYRRTRIAADLTSLVAQRRATEPLSVAAIGIGPGREIFDLFEKHPMAPLRVVGIDFDDSALAFCAEEARNRLKRDDVIDLFQDNLVNTFLGHGNISISRQDYIYSAGLADQLEDELVFRMINWAYDQLAPGGTLALGTVRNPDSAFMEYIAHWPLMNRSGEEMRALFSRSSFKGSEMRIETDPDGVQAFCYGRKP
jgi:CRP-like cAMP-binding protein